MSAYVTSVLVGHVAVSFVALGLGLVVARGFLQGKVLSS